MSDRYLPDLAILPFPPNAYKSSRYLFYVHDRAHSLASRLSRTLKLLRGAPRAACLFPLLLTSVLIRVNPWLDLFFVP